MNGDMCLNSMAWLRILTPRRRAGNLTSRNSMIELSLGVLTPPPVRMVSSWSMLYIPDVKMFDISNYTEERARKLHQLLIEIHEAGIVHLALYPRNMLIQGDTDRVLLIDYDLAQIFDPEHPEHPRFFTRERDLMDDFVEALVISQVPL